MRVAVKEPQSHCAHFGSVPQANINHRTHPFDQVMVSREFTRECMCAVIWIVNRWYNFRHLKATATFLA